MKEGLAAKGRHLRRSVSTPNVQHVINTSLTALPTDHKVYDHKVSKAFVALSLQSSCSKIDLTSCEDEECKVYQAWFITYYVHFCQYL